MWLGQKHKVCPKKGLVGKPGAPPRRARVSRGCPDTEGLEGCPGTAPFPPCFPPGFGKSGISNPAYPPWDVHLADIATGTPTTLNQ